MTPAARIAAIIDILSELDRTNRPADHYLREWGRAHRYAGSKDRAAIAERVFAIYRHRASFAWRMQSETPRALVIAALLADSANEAALAALFTGDKYAPAPLTPEEIASTRNAPTGPPLNVRGEFPEWLKPELSRAFGENLLAEMEAIQTRAPIDLRVNTLKATRDDVLAALRAEGYDAEPARYSAFAIRLSPGATGLEQTAAFKSGAFEFQDEAAQIACILANAKAHERVLDLAAGAGGKALALAALMNNSGEIAAEDIAANRLAQLTPRAARAGADIIRTGPASGRFDLIFIDAPCSGSGTWRRQPEQKWRLTPARLAELHATQDQSLDAAVARVAPNGRILYATCSILPSENEDRIEAFLARHPGFAIRPACDAWTGAPPPGLDRFFRATPRTTGTDGFFAAILAHSG